MKSLATRTLALAFVPCICSCGAERSGSTEITAVARSAAGAAAGLDIGSEIGTDPPVVVATDLGHNPEIATDGNGFLSVQEVNARIRAVRVDGSGNVLDATWIDLGEGEGEEQYYPTVAFGGGRYFIAWSAFLASGASIVKGRFVNLDGSVAGSSSLALSTGDAMYPSLAWDGQHFVAAWLALGGQGSNDIQVALFDADGTKVAGSEHYASTSHRASNPRIGVGSSGSFVAWEEYTHSDTLGDISRIRGARIAADGSIRDAGGLALSEGSHSETGPDVAASSNGFLVAWATDSDSTSMVRGSVVSDTGVVATKDFAISHSTGNAASPAVVFDGTDYLVAWADERDGRAMYGIHVAPNGSLTSTSDVKIAAGEPRYVGFASDHTNLAWNGSRYLLTFLGNGIEGSLVTQGLTISKGTIPLTGVPNAQSYPRMVFDGKNYLVVWTDERESSTNMSVRGVRVSSAGQVLDPEGIALSPSTQPAWGVTIGSNGRDSSQIVWGDAQSSDVWQRAIASDGSLGQVRAFASQVGSLSNLASNGAGYLAVLSSNGSSADGVVYGRLLDANGTGGTEFRIDSSTLNTGPVAIRAENDYLVAYSRSGTRIVPVSATGNVGTSMELSTRIMHVGGATSGANTLVAWGGHDDTQVSARMFVSGVPSGDPLVLATSSAGYGATVAWDGSIYWAVWETEQHRLLARSVGQDGTLGATVPIVDQECFAPVLASDGAGQMMISYTKYGESSRTRRIVSRLLGRGAGPADGGLGGAIGVEAGIGQGGAGGASGAVGAGGSSILPDAGGSQTTGGASGAGGLGTGAAGSAGGTAGTAGASAVGGSSHHAGDQGVGGVPAADGGTEQPPTTATCSAHSGEAGRSATPWASMAGLAFATCAIRRRRRAR